MTDSSPSLGLYLLIQLSHIPCCLGRQGSIFVGVLERQARQLRCPVIPVTPAAVAEIASLSMA